MFLNDEVFIRGTKLPGQQYFLYIYFRMRICYLADANSPHLIKWASHFHLTHHEVQIISFRQSDDPGVQQFTQVLDSRWSTKVSSLIFALRVRKMITAFKPDIVHAHYATSYGTLGRLCSVHPYVLSVWGSDVYDFPRRSWLHRKLLEKNLTAADHICSTSEHMAQETRRYYDGPTTVTPFGVDCALFRPAASCLQNDKDGIIIGTIKALEPPYGIEYLIRAFAILVKKYANVKKLRLVIAGEGSLRKRLEALTAELGIESHVTFPGRIAHSEVPKLLATFSVFCALSLNESFGVAVLEASACHVPVVVTNIGGLPEVAKDGVTGLVVAPRDIEAAAAAVSRLIDDEGLRRRLGAAGRELVAKNYDWSENATRMERLYESMLKNN